MLLVTLGQSKVIEVRRGTYVSAVLIITELWQILQNVQVISKLDGVCAFLCS